MTDEEIDAEIRFIASAAIRDDRELDQLVMTFAFAIEDPCGETEIRLARALIRMGRTIEPNQRANTAAKIEKACDQVQDLLRKSS